jgi:hypothetical protein
MAARTDRPADEATSAARPAPRRDQIAAALERGKARGEVRPDLDVNLAAHAVLGSFVYTGLVAGRPGRGWAQDMIDTLWPAFAAVPTPAAS